MATSQNHHGEAQPSGWVRRFSSLPPDGSILDVACGTGRHALWLAEAGAHVTAIDFSAAMLAVARSKPGADGVCFMVHDLHARLPFGSGAFDIVVSGLVLEQK